MHIHSRLPINTGFLRMLRYVRGMALHFRLLSCCRTLCHIAFRVVSWLPVVFVSVIIIWGYYVYVYIMNISGTFQKGPKALSILLSVFFLFVSHIILALQLTSYIRTIYTKHKKIPLQFHLTDEHLQRMDESVDCRALLREVAADLPVHTVSRNGSIRYCDKCESIKPDRCHHCSACDQCILKMDHHCPWVNNCVGYSNYKFFVLFLFYTVLLCVWFCLSGAYDFIQAWRNVIHDHPADKFQVIFCFFISAMFGFSTSVLFGFHIYLICWNMTTLENMQYPVYEGNPLRRLFHLGVRRNLQQVFGKNCLRAFLPVFTSEGDGASFPLHISVAHQPNHNSNDRGRDAELGQTSDSEVELFSTARSETQPLTQNSEV